MPSWRAGEAASRLAVIAPNQTLQQTAAADSFLGLHSSLRRRPLLSGVVPEARFGRIDRSIGEPPFARRCRRTEAVRRGKGLSGLVGRVLTPLEEGG